MAWRVARSLDVLLAQLNKQYPNRSTVSDGSVGDSAHQTRTSDHNPWYGPGIVTARDFTHDPAHGVDIDRFSDELAASRDPRIKYVICNGLIMSGSGGPKPWQWTPYAGTNPHRKHLHLSVVADQRCDDVRPWKLPMLEDIMATLDDLRRAIREELKDVATRADLGYARDQILTALGVDPGTAPPTKPPTELAASALPTRADVDKMVASAVAAVLKPRTP